MKKLFIHCQNSILVDEKYFHLEEQFVFNVDSDVQDVDYYINEQLTQGFLSSKINSSDIVFIKVALSQNYLEYWGIRLAYHIRLTQLLKEKSFIPIIFVAEESYQFLGITCGMPEILFTEGVYLMKDSPQEYNRILKLYDDGKIKQLQLKSDFVSKIRISPPANYESHHSISNEWCILRWIEMAKNIEEKERLVIKEKLVATKTLYFKYLEEVSLNNSKEVIRQEFKDKKREELKVQCNYKDNAKIYYIDDEVEKGWGILFKEVIFKSFTEKNKFDYYTDFIKGESKDNFVNRLCEKIEILIRNEGYNLFIIDLRLCDEDLLSSNDLSGFQIIRKIKKINKGVQVVVFTASKKAENVDTALCLGSEGYILKESPENILTRNKSIELFYEFRNKIIKATSKVFLAALYRDIQSIKNKVESMILPSATNNDDSFKSNAIAKNGSFDKIYDIMKIADVSLFSFALLECFSLLEKFCELYFVSPNHDTGQVILKNDSLQEIYRNLPSRKINTLMIIERGRFHFQYMNSRETNINVIFLSVKQLESSNMIEGPDNSSLSKILSVLKFRFNVEDIILSKIIELRYLRSNLAAHYTGNIDILKRKIEKEDILVIIDLFKRIILC